MKITALVLAVLLNLNTSAMFSSTVPLEKAKSEQWRDLGKYRITVFCEACNDPSGTQSASGKALEYGDVAMNGVPLGSKISIDGEIFTVVDRCGIDGTVDIFIPGGEDNICECNFLDYKEVRIKSE